MDRHSSRRTPREGRSGKGGAAPSRQTALEILIALRSGGFTEHVLSYRLEQQELRPEDRGLTTELVYGVLRWRNRLDAIIARLLDRPRRRLNPVVRDIVRLSLYQIAFLERVPDHAAVDQAVFQARSRFGEKAGDFVNALLRRFIRERDVIDSLPENDACALACYYSHPLWLVSSWMQRFGLEVTLRILEQSNSRAPLILRVNAVKSTPEEVSALLSDRGVGVSDVEGMPDALMVSDTGGPVAELPGYRDGLFAVQGAASQMIAPLVRAHEDHRILDACAAPGGKTAHLAALTRNKASIVAVDANAQRLDQTRANLARLGVASAQCLLGDSGSQPFVDSLAVFDRILVDAPCSNLGVLRHNPEVKYRIEPRDVDELAARQRLLVQNTARALRSGGILVYAVCTSTEKETIAVIESFLSENKEFMPAPIERSEVAYPEYVDDRGFLMTFPPSSEHPVDGFFAARLRRL